MRLKKAKQYVERILPILTEHIRENYCPDFVAPEIEFDNGWIPYYCWGTYLFGSVDGKHDIDDTALKSKIILSRDSRICSASLVFSLTHELGHALLDQVNPKFRYEFAENLHDADYRCLMEGIAEVVKEELTSILHKKALLSSSLYCWRVKLNLYLNPIYWKNYLAGGRILYSEGEEAVGELIENQSLVEIMEQADNPEFVHSIMRRK